MAIAADDQDRLIEFASGGMLEMAVWLLWQNDMDDPGSIYILGKQGFIEGRRDGGVVTYISNPVGYETCLADFVRENTCSYGTLGFIPAYDDVLLILEDLGLTYLKPAVTLKSFGKDGHLADQGYMCLLYQSNPKYFS